jgi:predicted GIY-YIG superfamily endonuclease
MLSKRDQERREILLKGVGWTIFIASCSDGSFYSGMARNLRKEMIEIHKLKKGNYISKYPELLPLKVVYKEEHLPFREAFAKYSYLRDCNRTAKLNVIKNKEICCTWPMYLQGFRCKKQKPLDFL